MAKYKRYDYKQSLMIPVSVEEQLVYPQRIAIVEPVFANILVNIRMDKFNLGGKIKVNIQWLLYCMVHNIEKAAN
jgi:hypothetical protein